MSTKQNSSQKIKSSIIANLVGAVIGVSVSLLAINVVPKYFNIKTFDLLDLMLIFPGMLLAFSLTIVIHELGHLIASTLSGFTFRVLTIGPFSILSTPLGVRVRTSFSVLSVLGGQQLSSPPVGGASKTKYIAYLVGGGVLNIITAVLFVWLAYAIQPTHWISIVLLLSAMFGLLLGGINLLPFRTAAGISTDGHHIRSLMRGGDDAKRFYALFAVVSDTYAGVRPDQFSPQVTKDLTAGDASFHEKLMAASIDLMQKIAHNDLMGARDAAAQLELLYTDIPTAMRSHTAVELAFFYAVHLPDVARSLRYAADLTSDTYMLSPASLHRGRAAGLYAQECFDDAKRECEVGLQAVDRSLNELDRVMEPELLNMLLMLITAKRRDGS